MAILLVEYERCAVLPQVFTKRELEGIDCQHYLTYYRFTIGNLCSNGYAFLVVENKYHRSNYTDLDFEHIKENYNPMLIISTKIMYIDAIGWLQSNVNFYYHYLTANACNT